MVGQILLELSLERGTLVYFPGKLFSSNVYLIAVENEAVAIDAGMPWTANLVLDYLGKNRSHLQYVLLTHSHFDHVMGLNRLKSHTEAKVVAHLASKMGDLKVDDGQTLEAVSKQLCFLVVYTGIHKPDHVWYFEKNNHILFVGDYFPTLRDVETMTKRRNFEPNIILPGHGKPTNVSPQAATT
jgi:glyoxylase-like metal-dependent hydrolase (beta-lactamase superfamily II)